jgi:hypothetical protein
LYFFLLCLVLFLYVHQAAQPAVSRTFHVSSMPRLTSHDSCLMSWHVSCLVNATSHVLARFMSHVLARFTSRQCHDSCLGTIHVSCLGTFHVLSCMFHVSSMALVCQALSPTPCVPAPLHANCPLLRTSRHSLHPTLHPNIYGYWHNHSCMQAHPLDTHSLSTALIGTRVGQNRISAPYMTVCKVISC